jgi:hypothetical protein
MSLELEIFASLDKVLEQSFSIVREVFSCWELGDIERVRAAVR